MEPTLIFIVLIILSLSVALNLKLTFSLYKKINHLDLIDTPMFTAKIGDKLPDFKGQTLLEKKWFHLNEVHQPTVLIFLSSRCPICKEKIPQIEAILPLLPEAGLLMKLISYEPKNSMIKFLNDSLLLNIILFADKKNYKKLNPSISTPFYIFVDHLGQLTTGGTIGDQDWMSFLEQMEEIEKASGLVT
jgi:hypothetical protein